MNAIFLINHLAITSLSQAELLYFRCFCNQSALYPKARIPTRSLFFLKLAISEISITDFARFVKPRQREKHKCEYHQNS